MKDYSVENDNAIEIVVHQYGFTPLYTPVYMALEELRSEPFLTPGGTTACNVTVTYRSWGTDAKAEQAVIDAPLWEPTSTAQLHIGLSEVVHRSDDGRPKHVVEYPFIKRLPLWGVAKDNNATIHEIADKNIISRDLLSFWNMFAGKLSLIQPHKGDLDGNKLKVSIYPQGSTVYRLFMKYLEESGHAIAHERVKYVGFEDEFDGLFENDIDIALTVHPWRALGPAAKRYTKLELVYTHLGKPEPFSSIFVKKWPTTEKFWRSFVNLLGALVQTQVEALYAGHDQILERAYKAYELAYNMREAGDNSSIEEDLQFAYALQILNDSRIYYYDFLPGQAGRADSKFQDRIDQVRQEWAKYLGSRGARDIAYNCSLFAAEAYRYGVDWHDLKSWTRCAPQHLAEVERLITGLQDAAQDLNQKCVFDDSLDKILSFFRKRKLGHFLGFVSLAKNAEALIDTTPWRVWVHRDDGQVYHQDMPNSIEFDFSPWVPGDALKDAFMHLGAQFRARDLNLTQLTADVWLPRKMALSTTPATQQSAMEGISWIWVEYEAPGDSKIGRARFIKDRQAKTLLNGWHVSSDGTVSTVFEKPDHGVPHIDSGGNVVLTLTPDQMTILVEKQPHTQGLLFTFRVAGVRYDVNGGA